MQYDESTCTYDVKVCAQKANDLVELNILIAEIELSLREMRKIFSEKECQDTKEIFSDIFIDLDALANHWITSNSG